MTTPRDPDALLVTYLADGMEVLPDRVVDAVLDEVHRTRQLAAFGRWRTRSMSRSAFGAAAVVAVLAVGGAFYLTQRAPSSVGTPSPTPSGSSSPSQPASPSAVPSPSVVPARAASWTATGSIAGEGPELLTATLLRDGRVLLIHSENRGNKYPAELYDPTTGSWTATGSTRGAPWGVTLLDGRVLAASGIVDPGSGLVHEGTAYTELYDPDTGLWTTTGSMVGGGETVTLLLDGRVLAAGGLGNYDDKTGYGGTGAAELYDPASGRWTVTGSMITPRTGHKATLLPDGKVLVAGGGGSWENATATAELYDPATGTWTATGAMSRPLLAGGTAALLPDGRVLVADFAPVAPPCAAPRCPLVFVAELYDPVTGTWTATESTATPHYLRYTATLLSDGMLLVAGGADSGSLGYGLLASAELYDPGTGSWTTTATMPVARAWHTATLLHDGKVLVVGGQGGGTSAELYDPGSP